METILAERVTRKQGVPPMREYLVRWKGLPKRKASWEREDALGKFAYWNRWFETAISTGLSMAWVGESVTNSLFRPPTSYGNDPSMGTREPLKPIYKKRVCSRHSWRLLRPELCGRFQKTLEKSTQL